MTGKVMLTLSDLGVLAYTSERNGTQDSFVSVAMQWAGEAQKEIERLHSELAALRADAERYRWLRYRTCGLRDNEGREYFGFPSMFGLRPVGTLTQGNVGQTLDAAIDAMAAHKEPSNG